MNKKLWSRLIELVSLFHINCDFSRRSIFGFYFILFYFISSFPSPPVMSQSFLLPGKCTSNLLNRYETRKTFFAEKKVSCSTSSVQQLRTLLISGILKLDSSWKVKVFETRTRQGTPPESIPSKSSDIYPPTYHALEQVNPLMGEKVTRAKRVDRLVNRQFDEYFSFDTER